MEQTVIEKRVHYRFSRMMLSKKMGNELVNNLINRDEKRYGLKCVFYEIIDAKNDIRNVHDEITKELYYKNQFQINALFSNNEEAERVKPVNLMEIE